jgi:hypothetical protein
MRLLKKRARGPYKAAQAAAGATYAYAVNLFGRNEWSTAAGVVIDGGCLPACRRAPDRPMRDHGV